MLRKWRKSQTNYIEQSSEDSIFIFLDLDDDLFFDYDLLWISMHSSSRQSPLERCSHFEFLNNHHPESILKINRSV